MKKYTGYLIVFLVVLASFACAKAPVSIVSIQDLLKEIIFIYRAESPGSSTQTAEQKTQSPYAPIKEGSNIYVYQSLTPENLAEMLVGGDTEKKENSWAEVYLKDLPNVENPKVKFGQTKEQLEKLIEWSYEQAATHTDEDNWGLGYPTTREELEKTVEELGGLNPPIAFQKYIGIIKEKEGKKYIKPIPMENGTEYSIGLLGEEKNKNPCEYTGQLDMIMNRDGTIKQTLITPTNIKISQREIDDRLLKKDKYQKAVITARYETYMDEETVQILKEVKQDEITIIPFCIHKEGENYKTLFFPPTQIKLEYTR